MSHEKRPLAEIDAEIHRREVAQKVRREARRISNQIAELRAERDRLLDWWNRYHGKSVIERRSKYSKGSKLREAG